MTNPGFRARLLLAIIMSLALVATACGGDDDAEVTDGGPVVSAGDDGTPADDTAGEDATPDPAPTAAATPDESVPGGGSPDVAFPTPAPATGTPALTEASKLTTVGLGEIFFGDTVGAAAKKAGLTWIGLPKRDSRPACYTVQPEGGPAGTVFTILNGRVERVDIMSPVITTRSGLGVGSTEADIAALFGDSIEITAADGGNEVAFVPTDEVDRDFRIIWSTDGTTTVAMRAGRLPGVLTAAPCA